jgi:hypothetical protein
MSYFEIETNLKILSSLYAMLLSIEQFFVMETILNAKEIRQRCVQTTANRCHSRDIYSFHMRKEVKVKQSRYTPWRRLGGEEV